VQRNYMTQSTMTRWTRWPILAVVAVMATACNKGQPTAPPAAADQPPASPPVATVNGTPISHAEYDFYLKSLAGQKSAELTPEQKSQVLDEMISMQLIAAQGMKDGLEKDPDVVARLGVAHMRLLADAESQKYLKGKEPTDAELHAEYDSAITALDKTEYHARHILVANKDQADQVIKRLKGGAKFEDLAKAQSIDNSKNNGGDLGWFTLARMVKPFSDAVKVLKKGEYTQEPVQTQFGWHVIKLEDTREVTPPPFDQVKEQVTNRVIQKKVQAYIADLRKDAKIDKTP
jgi:peptidyl-prolyl cis-trans isomerase C